MEDRPFFNPYFIGGVNQNIPPNMQSSPNGFGFLNAPDISPKEIYENQYLYYRCMNEYLDYMIKSKEYERVSQNTNNKN